MPPRQSQKRKFPGGAAESPVAAPAEAQSDSEDTDGEPNVDDPAAADDDDDGQVPGKGKQWRNWGETSI